MILSGVSEKIFKRKYAIDNESWEDTVLRVANYVASIEKEEDQTLWMKKFFELMHSGTFLPGGRILANAGTSTKNLMNCFSMPV